MLNKTKIIFVTSNENKFKDAQEFINSNFIIINEKIDLLEIQSTDNIEVMKFKIEEAYNKIINMEKYKSDIDNINVICEDTGLICENMHTFPGALIKFYLENVGITGISKYNGNSNSTAISVIGLKNKFDVQIFKGERTGKIKKDFILPSNINNYKSSWNYVFIPDYPKEYSEYNGLTYMEIDKKIKNAISHRNNSFKKLNQYLVRAQKSSTLPETEELNKLGGQIIQSKQSKLSKNKKISKQSKLSKNKKISKQSKLSKNKRVAKQSKQSKKQSKQSKQSKKQSK